MDLLRWRHVDMPRASVQVLSPCRRPFLEGGPALLRPEASSNSLFYGSRVLKVEQLADGHEMGASCTWKVASAKGAQQQQYFGPYIFANYRKARAAQVERRGQSRRIRNFYWTLPRIAAAVTSFTRTQSKVLGQQEKLF